MPDYFEIDMLEAGENKSGDAMAIRYGVSSTGTEMVHVVDGGYLANNDGQKLIEVIRMHYQQNNFIDHIVLTHSDTDHASGLRTVVEQCGSGTVLWMNRPWAHVDDILPAFAAQYTRDGLVRRLKEDYPHVAELEQIALERGIQVNDVFQGAQIGNFTVLAPSRDRYINLVVDSEKTPRIIEGLINIPQQIISAIRGWGEEHLKGGIGATSRENEMSVIQYSILAGKRVLLTGDAGVEGLEDAYQFAIRTGIILPGLDYFQAPHHGGRRNLSTDVLNKWLGPILPAIPTQTLFVAMISANRNDEHHPRKSVQRALIHRGGGVAGPKGYTHIYWPSSGIINRPGFSPIGFSAYPDETEE